MQDGYILRKKGTLIEDYIYFENVNTNEFIDRVLVKFKDKLVDELFLELKKEYPVHMTTVFPQFLSTDYTFVIGKSNLTIYEYGKKLCIVKEDTVSQWRNVFKNQEVLEKHYLYDDEMLNINYKKRPNMYRDMEKKFNQGGALTASDFEEPKHMNLLLSNEHVVDVWHRYDKPSYVKNLSLGSGMTVKFILAKEYSKWRIYIQLPYIRKRALFEEFTSEKKAMEALRKWIIQEEEHLRELASITLQYNKLVDELKEKTCTIHTLSEYYDMLDLRSTQKNWWILDSDELKKNIQEYYNRNVSAAV